MISEIEPTPRISILGIIDRPTVRTHQEKIDIKSTHNLVNDPPLSEPCKQPFLIFLFLRNPGLGPMRNPARGPMRNTICGPMRNPALGPIRNPALGPMRNTICGPIRNLVRGPM